MQAISLAYSDIDCNFFYSKYGKKKKKKVQALNEVSQNYFIYNELIHNKFSFVLRNILSLILTKVLSCTISFVCVVLYV